MITLTNPKVLSIVLGGTATVSYNQLIVETAEHHTVNRTISGRLRLTASADPEANRVDGFYTADANAGTLEFVFNQLDLQRKVTLTAGQITALNGWIDDVQSNLENGFITVGVVDGTFSAGV